MRNLLRQIFHTLIALCSYFVMQPAFAADLRVLTLTLDTQNQSESVKQRKFSALVQWVEENKPDVLLFQGAYNHTNKSSVGSALANATGYDLAEIRTLLSKNENFILAKKKYQMGQVKSIKLPHSPTSHAIGVRLIADDGKFVYVYNTKLNAKNDTERFDQLTVIDKIISDHVIDNYDYMAEARVILGGSFASGFGENSIQELNRRFYRDSFALAHPDKSENKNSNLNACTICSDPLTKEFNPTTSADRKNSRTDYLFSHGYSLQVRASTVVFSKPQSGIWLSSHSGVFTTFTTDNPVGNPVGSAPNPVYDRTDWATPTRIVHLNDDLLNCKAVKNCTHTLSDAEVSTEHGITFVNDTKTAIQVRIKSGAETYNSPSVTLKKGGTQSFYFEPNQRYDFSARKFATRKRLIGTVFSNLK